MNNRESFVIVLFLEVLAYSYVFFVNNPGMINAALKAEVEVWVELESLYFQSILSQ